MKISRYEFVKYLHIFANIYALLLVYVFMKKASQIVSLPPFYDIGITLLAGLFTSVISFLILRFKKEKLKTMFMDDKQIVIGVVKAILVFIFSIYFFFWLIFC